MSQTTNFAARVAATSTLAVASMACSAGEFAIDGAIPCARVNASRDQSLAAMLWVQGYLSGSNAARHRYGKGEMVLLPNKDDILRRVVVFCRQNPTSHTFQAALVIWSEVEAK